MYAMCFHKTDTICLGPQSLVGVPCFFFCYSVSLSLNCAAYVSIHNGFGCVRINASGQYGGSLPESGSVCTCTNPASRVHMCCWSLP